MSAAAKVSPFDVMAAAMSVDDSADAVELMRLAGEHLPKLIERGFEANYIEDAARAMLVEQDEPTFLERDRLVQRFLLAPGKNPAAEATATVLYSVAEASFWLGMVAGQKLAGGGR